MTIVNKEHFTTLYSLARARAMIKKNSLAGWAKAGLFPFYPDRVFRDIAKPVSASPIPTICEDVDYVRKTSLDPMMPVLSEGLMSLLSLIKQDSHDEPSKQRHQRLMQKPKARESVVGS